MEEKKEKSVRDEIRETEMQKCLNALEKQVVVASMICDDDKEYFLLRQAIVRVLDSIKF